VDVSGSDISVGNSTFLNITDKAVSAGEDSTVVVSSTVIKSVGIGIASKDLSNVTVTDSQISLARVAGLSAYTKKAVFGPAQISATNVSILEAEYTTLVQSGSTVLVDGVEMPTVDLDIDSLYEQGILGN
jgi:hypothetical protein